MKSRKILIAPSILSADFSQLGKEIKAMERAKADLIHIDVMDGHFVPNITIGPVVIKDIRKHTRLPFDVHLMINNPLAYLDDFIKAGSDIITVHLETCAKNEIRKIKEKLDLNKIKFGISINPATPLEKLREFLNLTNMILVMSVNPGFAGQPFKEEVLPKIIKLRKIYHKDIEIDGGINDVTAKLAIRAGANVLVAGSYIFGDRNRIKMVEKLRQCR
ncbi:MAG: ribulose-phosphate 3-epimerase [Candidatus Omnitrophica bacterium]|nr:ribulose-phosphate 3-epimerase [Candidatus Omnitrophota bacterium]